MASKTREEAINEIMKITGLPKSKVESSIPMAMNMVITIAQVTEVYNNAPDNIPVKAKALAKMYKILTK